MRPEQEIHRTIVRHLQVRGAPGLVGGYRRPSEAAIFSGLGVRAGVSDLLLWHDGKSFALAIADALKPTNQTSINPDKCAS